MLQITAKEAMLSNEELWSVSNFVPVWAALQTFRVTADHGEALGLPSYPQEG